MVQVQFTVGACLFTVYVNDRFYFWNLFWKNTVIFIIYLSTIIIIIHFVNRNNKIVFLIPVSKFC